jgi:hypothetical protein
MSGELNIAEVRRVVMDTISADFTSVKILDVQVIEWPDDEDGTTLEINVVFEGKPKDLDAGKVSGAVCHVRPKLKEIGVSAFPLFSFLTKKEAEGLAAA